MILEDYRTQFKTQLSALYVREEVDSLVSIAMGHILKMNRVEIALSRKQEITQKQLGELDEVLKRLLASEPIQYITGSTQFYGLELQVNRDTLIPRPETEELVAWVIASTGKTSGLKILDIGTGSGCIAISLAHNLPNTQVEGVDISLQAIETATSNAKSNDVEVAFFKQDVLSASDFMNEYDVIVSNPPYVRTLEKAEMNANVLKHEPHAALFVTDEDPLVFYRKIATLARQNLKSGGQLFFEINEYLGEETVSLIKEIGFNQVELRKDLFGKDRMVRAIKV